KYTYVFNSKAPYGYDAPYIIEAVGDGLEPVRSERITTAAKDTPITGGSSGGCDAGFGVFGLLAATGAVALLRKKD
ncbi:MAG: SYNERG-CTERM sorting domain-containing protein, partial [Synergistaceae bacterium]|nr:SYNERG-CTERM sorting domain-containing protein [Synergistaceae bacterium]